MQQLQREKVVIVVYRGNTSRGASVGQRESHPVTGDLAPRLLTNDLPGKAALNHGQGKQFPVDLRQF